MENFYEVESNAAQEYLVKLGSESENYTKALQNYKTLVECKKVDETYKEELDIRRYDSETKRIEAEARKLEAEAKKLEAENRSIEAEARIREAENRKLEANTRLTSTIIETAGRVAMNMVSNLCGFGGFIIAANYEETGTLSNKLVNIANRWISSRS